MRHSWVFVFLFGCSLVANTDDFRFDDTPDVGDDTSADTATDSSDTGVDSGPDADAGMDGDTIAPECNLDSECDPLPHQPGRCVDGMCTNTDCEEGYANCDGNPDNGCEADTRVDSEHCGECELSCAIDRTVTACVDSMCEFVMCDPGFEDCNDEPGCESDLSDPATCGSCTPCAVATPLCDNTGDSPVCVSDCPAGTTLCGTSRCVDLTMDTSACGDCETVCDDVPGSSPICMESSCGFVCDDDRGDCDEGAGCETDLTLSVDHCGGCDRPCEGGSATWSCAESACVVATCTDGMRNCDDEVFGCESDPMTDAMNCGGCGFACGEGERCVGAVCDPVVDVSTFDRHACAVRDSGRVVCWGLNTAGQLGDGTLTHSGIPVGVLSPDEEDPLVAVQVTVGRNFECLLDSEGLVYCLGRGLNGEVGNGVSANVRIPNPVVGDAGFSDRTFEHIEAGVSTACGLADNGTVWCWGRNQFGQLGDGTLVDSNRASQVSLGGPAVDLAVGGGHACVAMTTGGVRCWGSGTSGQLGTGTNDSSSSPVSALIPAGNTIVEVAVGGGQSCARADDGAVFCWGLSTTQQAGLAASTSTPTAIDSLSPAESITARANVTCATLADGPVCLGDNTTGALGRGTTGGSFIEPARPMGLSADAIIAPGTASCAIDGGRPELLG